MKTEDIIEGLNRSVEDCRKSMGISTTGHLVLQRTVKPHQTFKAYKEYSAVVWFVKGIRKYELLHYTETARVIDGQEDTMIRKMNIELSRLLFNWVNSDYYVKVVKGECDGYTNE